MVIALGGVGTAEAFWLPTWNFSHTDRVTIAVGVSALGVYPAEQERVLDVGAVAVGQSGDVAAPVVTATANEVGEELGLRGGNV